MLHAKWRPGTEPDEENLALALAMEDDYWKKMEVTMQNAYAKAWGAG